MSGTLINEGNVWGEDLGLITSRYMSHIKDKLTAAEPAARESFDKLLDKIKTNVNHAVTEDYLIEILAQYLITKPVFEAFFRDYNSLSCGAALVSIKEIVEDLLDGGVDLDKDRLEKFYDKIREGVKVCDTDTARQKLLIKIYDEFFQKGFPRTAQKLGIAYTPIEIVDFIIQSIEDVLTKHFGKTLGDEGVHILDPFTGTGTFIIRLLQSGLIPKEKLQYKYENELHANEIVLLAYYIAAVNIECAYHSVQGGDYQPFKGICLTDTFQLYENDNEPICYLKGNGERRMNQKRQDIRVIFGNPPYSAGQGSANDNNANVKYERLDGRIRETYAKYSSVTNKNALYDSYIRAIRWASDRIGDSGVVAFITGSAWIERKFAEGMRKCLAEEYSDLYIFHLRGDIRKNMLSKGRAGEGENIFGQYSMTGSAISILVKKKLDSLCGNIYFHDIGENLKRIKKIERIKELGGVEGISSRNLWQCITPDKYHDWLNQRTEYFDKFIKIGDKKDNDAALFSNYSLGVSTNRDAWCYNASKIKLIKNMQSTISFYNSEADRYANSDKRIPAKDFINNDSKKISWSRAQVQNIARNKNINYHETSVVKSIYRPFTKEWMYFNHNFNEMVYQIPQIFPASEHKNRVICVSGIGARSGFSALMTDCIPCLDMVEKGQCFPLYLYEKSGSAKDGTAQYTQKDGISDEGLKHVQKAYLSNEIDKETIFYYVYGLLHSKHYRERFADNLSKQLPRIPCVKDYTTFLQFADAGRKLAKLHIEYETVQPYDGVTIRGAAIDVPHQDTELFRVTKMKYGKGEDNKTVIFYNEHITITGIPLRVYEYIINGKSAIDWVMARQSVLTHKDSGIVNDANDYANETMQDPAYSLRLLLRVITVSLKTLDIVDNLPEIDF